MSKNQSSDGTEWRKSITYGGGLSLSDAARATLAQRRFGIYVHVPFCAVRCGYCDFNTYVVPKEEETRSNNRIDQWLAAVVNEIQMAGHITDYPVVQTIFFGGGTPSLIGAARLNTIVHAIREHFSVVPQVEITAEANPESTSEQFFTELIAGGFTRISLGMQSAIPRILQTLDRKHTPGLVAKAVTQAKAAGFLHINLDLIYGTPGETLADLQVSLETVVTAQVDHVSAYALTVEPGTVLARKISKHELPNTQDDYLADCYGLVDNYLNQAGFYWYEISNWAAQACSLQVNEKPDSDPVQLSRQSRCQHNMSYWNGDNWWGIGPGAHSHIGGMRWWNHKLPARYTAELQADVLPIAGLEQLDAEQQHMEAIMLGLRLREGIAVSQLSPGELHQAEYSIELGLLNKQNERLVATDRGRFVIDGVIRDIYYRDTKK